MGMVFQMCKFRQWEWTDLAGMGWIGNTENHYRTSVHQTRHITIRFGNESVQAITCTGNTGTAAKKLNKLKTQKQKLNNSGVAIRFRK